jgi:tetratricopeptide (TPR) repeat protein
MWVLPLVCISIYPLFVASQSAPATYTIYGVVQLPNGSPAPRISVRISSQASLSIEVFTNDIGRYEIPALPRGRYYVTAANPSSPEQFSDPVEVDATRGLNNRILVNISLRSGANIESRRGQNSITVALAEASQQVPKAAHKAFLRAQTYQSKKQFPKALASFDFAIKIFPSYFQAIAGRGHLNIAMGQTVEAAQDFAHALDLDDRYEPALRGSGLCKFQAGRFAESIGDFERAASEAPGNFVNHLFIGMAYYALDRRDAARSALQKALSVDPMGAVRAHVHLANLWIKESRSPEAIAEIRAYLAKMPNAPDAEQWRAVAIQLQRRSPKN